MQITDQLRVAALATLLPSENRHLLADLIPDLSGTIFGGASTQEQRVAVQAVTGRPIPEINPATGYPPNPAYLRSELQRWAARTAPYQPAEDYGNNGDARPADSGIA